MCPGLIVREELFFNEEVNDVDNDWRYLNWFVHHSE